jgi:hypothetical protein
MTHSPNLEALSAALCAAQAEGMLALKANKNSHLNSKYADRAAVLEAMRPKLGAHGLSFTQHPGTFRSVGDKNYVGMTCMLLHSSGQWIMSTAEAPAALEQKGLHPAQCLGLCSGSGDGG